MSMAGKVLLSTSLRSRMISELPVPLNCSKITPSGTRVLESGRTVGEFRRTKKWNAEIAAGFAMLDVESSLPGGQDEPTSISGDTAFYTRTGRLRGCNSSPGEGANPARHRKED